MTSYEMGRKSLATLTKERGQVYGPPSVNHARTARFFSAYLQNRGAASSVRILPEDIIFFNILQKMSRYMHGVHDEDTLLDIQGYVDNLLEMKDDN